MSYTPIAVGKSSELDKRVLWEGSTGIAEQSVTMTGGQLFVGPSETEKHETLSLGEDWCVPLLSRGRHYDPPKRPEKRAQQHSVSNQKIMICRNTAVRTSNVAKSNRQALSLFCFVQAHTDTVADKMNK